MADLILEYLKEIEKETSRGVAPEHTYRPALKKLVESFDNGIVAVNEPKRIACGAPDYLISRRNLTLGTRYADFLKIDFPRVPLTSDKTLFAALVKLGGELSALHLMESPELSKTSVAFPVAGNSEVEKGFPKFNVDEASSLVPQQPRVSVDQTRQDASSTLGRVYINKTQYFAGVPSNVWNFTIGGYQVCEKWLKDRRERQLTHDDLQHYKKIVAALSRTIELMQQVDETIPAWPVQ